MGIENRDYGRDGSYTERVAGLGVEFTPVVKGLILVNIPARLLHEVEQCPTATRTRVGRFMTTSQGDDMFRSISRRAGNAGRVLSGLSSMERRSTLVPAARQRFLMPGTRGRPHG